MKNLCYNKKTNGNFSPTETTCRSKNSAYEIAIRGRRQIRAILYLSNTYQFNSGNYGRGSMIKIAIVEDEKSIAEGLFNFLDRYAEENDIKIQVKYFPCTTEFLTQYDGFDIVLMDIEFKNDMNGIEASRKLRKLDSVVTLIFVTSFEQFAVRGYEVHAFDFIVKPVVYSDFSLRMTRALQHVSKEEPDTINIMVKGGVKILSVKSIKYIEVIKHKLIFHTVEEVFECNGSLGDMEKQLSPKGFVRCNHCYLVNLWYVRGVDGFSIDLDGEKIAISQSKRKEFMSALNRYLAR